MSVTALTGAGVFDGAVLRPQAALLISNGRVLDIIDPSAVPADAIIEQLAGGLLAPGLIDAQVNGGGGVMLNDHPTADSMAAIAAAHARFGTTGLLPTLITDTTEVGLQTIAAAVEAVGSRPGVLGLHLEGPHLAPARKGVHRAEYMHPLTDADADVLIAAREKIGVLLVTVAVEQIAPAVIRRLHEAGVIVSLGHTNADFAATMAAFEAGATGVTHLYNAMSQLGSREPGVFGAALHTGSAWCGIIADGQHVHPASLAIAIRGKRAPGRVFLVTDAMSTVGSDIDTFEITGRTAYRRAERLEMADGGLAGSNVDLLSCVRFTHRQLGLPIEEALRMGSLYPAQFLGLERERGHLGAGTIADLIHIDADIQLTRAWIAGVPL